MRSRGAYFALHRELRDRVQGVVAKLQLNIFKFEELLVLTDDRVLRLGEDLTALP